jgi:IclR family acetate operon transcriptional repressor
VSNDKTSRSVERALAVLCTIARSEEPIGVSEIARQTAVSKSTVHLSIQTMRALGFVEQDSVSGRYVLGLAAAQLGAAALGQSRLITAVSDPMRDLADRSREAVSLGVRSGSEVVFVKRFETSHVLRTSIREGTRMPLHASASGKCILLGLTDDEVCELYPDELLPEQASKTLRGRSELLAELAEVRQRGYATSHDEYLDGVSGAAVPIRIGEEIVGSLSIAGPTARFRADGWVDDLMAIVSLGARATTPLDDVAAPASSGA